MDVYVQTLAREPYPTLFRASAARLHAAGFGTGGGGAGGPRL